MSGIMETVQEHPYMTAGGVIAALVIVFVISRGGGGGTVVTAGGTSVDPAAGQLALANVAGQVQLGTAQLGADVASKQIEANLHIVDSNNATAQNIEAIRVSGATDIAALAASISIDNIRAQETVALNGQQTQLEMQQNANANATEQLRISTQGTLQALQTQASTLLGAQQIAAQTAMHTADVNAAIFHDQLQTAFATEKYKADTQVVLNREWAPIAIQLQQISSNTAQAGYASQVAITQAQNDHGSLFGGLFQW